MKPRKPIRKKTSKRKQKQMRDLELREQIFERDGFQCVVPVKYRNHGGSLQAAHVYSKGRWPNLRHVAENLLTMCWSHHFFWAHKEPIEFTDWWRATYPDRAELLQDLKLSKEKVQCEN
jgi:hypothetical protein